MELKLVDDLEPCTFCPCEGQKKLKIPYAFSLCTCPCHWRNAFGKAEKLEAVKKFFGKDLGISEE